jgi:radical SAM superfamily enzyme YgiQ (UPF0313 family)
MAKHTPKAHQQLAQAERGAIRKPWRGRLSVALVYPNRYEVGMSNLGFQAVYRLFNEMDDVVCERAFLPPERPPTLTEGPAATAGPVFSIESGRPLGTFDVIAFSLAFENDYPGLLRLLYRAGLPLRTSDRHSPQPLVLAGGVACFLNPEPLAPFVDAFLIGEAEAILPAFCDRLDLQGERDVLLEELARHVPGVYVPRFYLPEYHPDGTLKAFKPLADVPNRVVKMQLADLSATATCSRILTPHTTFADTYLIEVGRGCPHGCRFCSAGYIYRPPRFRPLEMLQHCMARGAAVTDHIGLVGAAVSDLPDIGSLCRTSHGRNVKISFSSLRADNLNDELLDALRRSGTRTATIAPDAGSARMRRVINKGLTEEQILQAAENLVAHGIPNLKVYFMVGLPTETTGDVAAIVGLTKKIKHVFLQSSRTRRRMGTITLSLNCFVPKPFTPFQWAAMDPVPRLKDKLKKVRTELRRVANVRVHADVPRWAYIQALLARGDRRVADLLQAAHAAGGNWPRIFKASALNPDFYVLRERPRAERFPWDFIDHGLSKQFLAHEYSLALQGRSSPPCPLVDCSRCGVCPADRR